MRTRLAHAPENMDQFWVDNASHINRQDGSEVDRLRILRIVPDREAIDLIAYKVDSVSLTESHQRNDRFTRIAAAWVKASGQAQSIFQSTRKRT